MLKMMNRSKKANQGGQRGVRGTPLDGKDTKVGRQGVGFSASTVGPAKPSLAPMAPQSQVGVPGQPTAAGGGSGGVGDRTKKVKQQSGSKGGGGKATGGSRSGRPTAAVGKETSATKVGGDSAHGGGQLGFEVPGGGGGVGGLGSLGPLAGPKMERSNSFFLARKLSSLYSKLSGSRENVSSANAVSASTGGEETVDRAQPFQFVRSRSMSSIQLKRAYRRSQNESTLQNLQEDAILERSESTEETAGPAPRDEAKEPVVSAAIPVTPDTPPPMPRFERSNSILASIRRKISFRSDRRSSTVSSWSTSLQNLRQEDFMISYDDLSFIDYDQFNSYETNLLKRQSAGLVAESFDRHRLPPPVNVSDVRPEELAQAIDNAPALEATNTGVIRRRRKNDNLLRTTLIRKSMDVESNLDRDKNVYRNSLDAEKLLCISKVNRKSFRWSADVERDVVALDLDSVDFTAGKPLAELAASRQTTPPPYDVCDSGMIDGSESVKLGTIDDGTVEPTLTASSVGYVSRSESMKRSRSYGGEGGVAFEEGFGHPAKQMQQRYGHSVRTLTTAWHIHPDVAHGLPRKKTTPPAMDEHVQLRQESTRERKLLRSIEPVLPVCDVYPAPTDRNVHAASLVPAAHPPLPSGPTTPSTLPTPALPNRANAEEKERHLARQQSLEKHDTTPTRSPPIAPAVNNAAALSLILPHNLSRSFDQTAAQSPPKYQIYHQFSRISSTTQQFIQRQQQQQQQQQQHPEQQPQATHQTSQLQHQQQSPQTQPASPVTNYQAPLCRKASYGSSHYAPYARADPQQDVIGFPQRVRPTTAYQQPQQQQPETSLLNSKPMDQRSNNPFILNFNNISGCCLKNSPTSASSPSTTSPTVSAPASAAIVRTTTTTTTTAPSASSTTGAKRSRSLLLKSTSPLQQTLSSSPVHASPPLPLPPQCPPVPPRLSQIHSLVNAPASSIATSAALATTSSSSYSSTLAPSPSGGSLKSASPTDIACTLNSAATSEELSTAMCTSNASAVTATIVTGACYVTPPTPAPVTANETKLALQAMMFGSVPPTGMSLASPTGNKPPVDAAVPASAEAAANAVRKKRDDFLKTTMKICLVVSPPSRMQMKSLSLTHLDEIERQATTPTIITNDPQILKGDNSDTSNASIASGASGSVGYGGGTTMSGGSSTQAVSPKDVCVTVTSGTALIGISNSGGGCINPAYDNGDANHQPGPAASPGCLHRPNDSPVGDAGSGISAEKDATERAHEIEKPLMSPSSAKAVTLCKSMLGGSGPSTSSLKKKSSSFLHRERKKPILTRSQVSSSEYFSVCFESDNNDAGVLIPATKGVRLAECLRASLSRRSLSFSQIYVTDNGFNNPHETGMRYSEPLDANMDISALAGRTLIVSERDGAPSRPRTGAHVTLQKAASVGNQPSMMSSTNKLFTSTSTDDNYDQSPKASLSASGKQSKQKWTIPFGSKGPQKSKLCELLDSYNKEIPKSTSSSSNFNNPEYVDALVGLRNLPQCWTEIVNSAGMCESETKIQSAIWELVTTEVYYILALQTVTDLFLACLEDIQSQNILTDVDQNKLFSNIRDIWEANLRFWTLYLHPMVRHSQRTMEPMSIYYFQPGFVDFATIFTPYTKYCAEQSTCQFYCKEMYHNNALFMTYCAWCESQKMCNRLRLADILVRPMQRLTKYGLLLAAIKKHITDEAEGEAIDAMIHSVEEFVAGVNSHLTTRQESERLKGINARIDSYDVVDSNNETLDRMVKQHSVMFDLCQPLRGIDHGRKVFVEGDLKYKDSTGKMDVHCFLFTDFLLVCKKIKSDKLKIIRQPYMTDRLMVQLKDQTLFCCYMNELNMVVAAFSLQSPKAQHWYDSITKVKHIYNRMKLGAFGDVRQYGNIINISNSCNNSTSNSNMNINNDNLSIKKSPLNSSIGSRVSSLNNSHSGSVDLNESKQVSIDFEKTNSLSSDEGAGAAIGNAIAGAGMMHAKYGVPLLPGTSRKPKNTVSTMQTKSSNSLTVQPYSLGQSMPNLNLNSIQNSNTLSVPGTSSALSHSGMVLLSPSQRGISYPPPSPTRATLRRGFAFSTSIKNPPLIKTRNVPSQQSFTLSQQQSFNSATLGQQGHLGSAATNCASSSNPSNSVAAQPTVEGNTACPPLPSTGISFFKRKNSFQRAPNSSTATSTERSFPNET